MKMKNILLVFMAMLAFVFVSCTIDPNGESTPGTNTDPEDWRNSEYYRYYVGANSSQHNASRSNIANIMPVFNTQEAVAGGAPAINPHVVAGLLKVLDEVPQTANAEDFSTWVASTQAQNFGAVYVRLFDRITDGTEAQNEFTGNSTISARWWRVVYSNNDVVTLMMAEPYRRSTYEAAKSNLLTDFSAVSAKFPAIGQAISAAPFQTWQGYMQTSVATTTNGTGTYQHEPLTPDDLVWLPSSYETVRIDSIDGTQEENPIQTTSGNLGVRSGLWRLNASDRGFSTGSGSVGQANASHWTRSVRANGTVQRINNASILSTAAVDGDSGIRPAIHLSISALRDLFEQYKHQMWYGHTVTRATMNDQIDLWYGSAESIRIADNFVRFQLNNGGWLMTGAPESYSLSDGSAIEYINPTPAQEQQQLASLDRNDDTTGDRAIIEELRYMIKMYKATGNPVYRESYEKALERILSNERPNGGFPRRAHLSAAHSFSQIAYNDDATSNVLNLWLDILNNDCGWYSTVDNAMRQRLRTSFNKGVDVILKTQVYSEAQRMLTGWNGAHDNYTYEPVWMREWEPVAIWRRPSIGNVNLLMRIENPSAQVQNAIHSFIKFFNHTEIFGVVTRSIPMPNGVYRTVWRELEYREGSRGYWASFTDIDTFEPLFFDRLVPRLEPGEVLATPPNRGRDNHNFRNLYDANGKFLLVESYMNISNERRQGYGYISSDTRGVRENYEQWLRR